MKQSSVGYCALPVIQSDENIQKIGGNRQPTTRKSHSVRIAKASLILKKIF
jgi:hypothetical protein